MEGQDESRGGEVRCGGTGDTRVQIEGCQCQLLVAQDVSETEEDKEKGVRVSRINCEHLDLVPKPGVSVLLQRAPKNCWLYPCIGLYYLCKVRPVSQILCCMSMLDDERLKVSTEVLTFDFQVSSASLFFKKKQNDYMRVLNRMVSL